MHNPRIPHATLQWMDAHSFDIVYFQDNGLIKERRWHADLHSKISRKLINEGHGVFMHLQDLKLQREQLDKLAFAKISRQYRSVLQSCLIDLKEMIDRSTGEDCSNLQAELDLLTIMEMVWHLCEILLIDQQPGGYCLPSLVEWVKLHFTGADRSARDVMTSDDPFSHFQFWPTIYGFVMQGRLREVAELLTHHPERDRARFDAFASMEELLLKMPMFQVFDGQSANSFISNWRSWKSECEHRLRDGDFARYPELEGICEILIGQDAALSKYKELADTWYPLLVAKILYTDPTVTVHSIKRHTAGCIEMFSGFSKASPLDDVILAVLCQDLHKVIEKSSECLPNWWFVAHLTDMLYHCYDGSNVDFVSSAELREFFLLEHSANLMAQGSLWMVAADYLLTCPIYGRAHLETYLENIPVENEKKALKIIKLCERNGFSEQAKTVCKVMGMRAILRKRFGVALSWCLRSKDQGFASVLTEQFLKHYAETGLFLQADLIDNLGSAMLLDSKLTFLAKYREFHKLYGQQSFVEAGLLLTSLLTSGLAPKKFWKILLLDSLTMLESEEIVFDSNQTFELMHCLKELQLCVDATCSSRGTLAKASKKAEEEEEGDRLALLQLSLTRNLSRALIASSSFRDGR